MVRSSALALFFYLLQASLLGSSHAGGPVYVNPAAAAAAAAAPAVDAAQLVTQTVYGFLDFTTTIGNTVMVFSPQSAPAAPEPSPAAPAPVITTQPPASVASAAPEIKPSKASAAKSSDKKVASSATPPPPPPPTPAKKPAAEPKPAPASTPSSAPPTAPAAAPPAPPAAAVPAAPPAVPAPVAPVAPAVSSVVEVRGGPVAAPQPAPSSKVEVRGGPASVVASKVEVLQGWSTKVEVRSGVTAPPALSSVVEVRVGGDENNVDDPEYDFLSRQPAQVVDETYKVINLKPSSKFHKNRASVPAAPGAGNQRPRPAPTPTGQGPRILKTAAPQLGSKARPAPPLDPTPAGSLHEETVALPLEQLFASQPALNRASRRPAPAPAFSSRFHRNRAGSEEDYDQTQQQQRNGKAPPAQPQPSRAAAAARPSQHTLRPSARKGGFSKHFGRSASATPELATVSVYSSEPSAARRYQSAPGARRSGFRPAATAADARPAPSAPAAADTPTSRRYKSRTPQPSAVGDPAAAAAASTSLYKFKLSRPAGRWSYKTTPKPRVAIRRQDEDNAASPSASPVAAASPPQPQAAPTPDDAENEPASHLEPEQVTSDQTSFPASPDSEEKPAPTAETIKVEISTPADFSDVYYELATIKSPYTFQVGTVKNTRYITVTSTFQKTLSVEPTSASGGVVVTPTATAGAAGDEPLTENLLASTLSPHYERREPLDSSIATLPPIALAGDASTPPLETLTETFSTTQLLLKTHILPVIYEGNTTRYTLVQSYHVTRLVTALKTLPPMDVYHFVPSKTLTDLNTRLEEAGSELHLELDFGEEDGKEEGEERPAAALRALAPDLDLSRVGSDFDLADVDRSRLPELQQHLRLKKAQKPEGAPQNQLMSPQPAQPPALSPEQLQQLALLRFLNPAAAAALPQVITTSRPVVKLETVYESHVIPVFNGQTTSYSTISRPVATVSKTEYEVGTSTLPLPPLAPVLPQNPLYPNQQPQFAVTSSPLVTQTVVTATDSKVLKLTFGAKTAYTTLYSTRLVPTVLTTYLTASVPVQPTAPAFPGYFPPAYPQFPFVG